MHGNIDENWSWEEDRWGRQDKVHKSLNRDCQQWTAVVEGNSIELLTQMARSRAASPVPHMFSNGPTLTSTQHAMSRPPIPKDRREITAVKILIGFLKCVFAGVGLM
jgi:hypothetical protein